jgi:LysM repeat protein
MAQVHTVSKGDTIYRICQSYNISQYALRYNNNLWTNSINVGQQLNIPERYTVQSGDNLNLIGEKYGVEAFKIKLINQLKSDTVDPGKILLIPAKSNTGTYAGANVQNNNFNVSRGGERISPEDFDLLARIITAEADSESYNTQVAVGATVLNRVNSPKFPNTIRGVIYQTNQFQPVSNGQINKPASESCKKAARDALNGSDPSDGALYFFESWVPNRFLQSRPVSKVMDAFTFAY